MKPSVQLEPLPVYSFLVSKRGCCVALRSIARLFQVASVLSNAMGLLHLDIHVFLESRLVAFEHLKPRTLWLCNPMIRIAFHANETRNQGLLNAKCQWLCVVLD